jgi:putative membrane protein
MAIWTRLETALFFGIALLLTLAYSTFGVRYLVVPWAPLAAIGTAVAFIIGFQNNAAYGRIWEARKIWVGIVNATRSLAMKVTDMVTNEHTDQPISDDELAEIRKEIFYRHIAWLTALRHAMRQSRKWEVFEDHKTNREWSKEMHVPERVASVEDDLFLYLPDEEWHAVTGAKNKQAQVLYLQSNHFRRLKERGLIWEFAFVNLEDLLQEMFTLQGKSERIKNFPYPRQYSTLSHIFVWLFLLLLPLAVIPEFAKVGASLTETHPTASPLVVWMAVPFCTIVSWIFHTMERIGRVGENPFEGSANDVPISTISRGLEIELRQLLGEDEDLVPRQFPEIADVQM